MTTHSLFFLTTRKVPKNIHSLNLCSDLSKLWCQLQMHNFLCFRRRFMWYYIHSWYETLGHPWHWCLYQLFVYFCCLFLDVIEAADVHGSITGASSKKALKPLIMTFTDPKLNQIWRKENERKEVLLSTVSHEVLPWLTINIWPITALPQIMLRLRK